MRLSVQLEQKSWILYWKYWKSIVTGTSDGRCLHLALARVLEGLIVSRGVSVVQLTVSHLLKPHSVAVQNA